MNFKRLLAALLCAIMILAMVPVMSFTASAADGEGLWTTNRQANEIGDDVDIYRAAAGYHYEEGVGFVTESDGLYTNTNPFLNVETKEKVNVKDGLYLEVIVNDFSYNGVFGNADYWVSFNIWSEPTIFPGQGGYGEGYLNLIRGGWDGEAANSENYITTDEKGFSLKDRVEGPIVQTEATAAGDKFTFEVTYDETNGYTFIVCGTTILSGSKTYNDELNRISESGDFYVGVCLHSTEKDGTASLTVSKYGDTAADAEVPYGSDSKAPEINPNIEYVCKDPDTVPVDTPALLWNADWKQSMSRAPQGMNMDMTALGDYSYRCEAKDSGCGVEWNIKQDLAYDGYDFDTFAILVKNLWCRQGRMFFCAGDIMAPSESNWAVLNQFATDTVYYGVDEEYSLIFVNLDGQMNGRIHKLKIYFELDDSNPEAMTFDILYMGMFRSKEEAINYTNNTYNLPEPETKVETEPETTEETEPETSAETLPETQATVTDVETEPVVSESKTEATSEPTSESATQAAEEGCASVVGVSAAAVVLAAAAAAVALKKKED